MQTDVIVIGSGIGGLVAAALLARYGRRVTVCESHTLPGGAAHAFKWQGYTFDSGPSFYCGLSDATSANPLRQVLDSLEEPLPSIAYDPFGHYHFPEQTFPVYGDGDKYRHALAQVSPQAAADFDRLEQRLLDLYAPLQAVPSLALRADWKLLPLLLRRYGGALVKLLPHLRDLGRSMGDIVAETVQDPWLRQLLDLECFLLSGMKADATVAPEMAFMFGERSRSVIDYPIGGSGAIIEALVRGLKRWGGELRLGTHVEKIWTEQGRARGVVLQSGERLEAATVISNATIWDTYGHLLGPDQRPTPKRKSALATPAVDSFMHLHLGIRAEGLEGLIIHHVVVHSTEADIAAPGNTCMVSIPTVLDPNLSPPGHHAIHAYTLETWAGWQRDESYEAKKREKAEPLFRALEKIIPDVRQRIEVELIGTPLTHSHFLRRYRGTYGPAIAADQGPFPSCKTPIQGLYRVGDSTLPGIGVPAVAASGILCANQLVSLKENAALLDYYLSKAVR